MIHHISQNKNFDTSHYMYLSNYLYIRLHNHHNDRKK